MQNEKYIVGQQNGYKGGWTYNKMVFMRVMLKGKNVTILDEGKEYKALAEKRYEDVLKYADTPEAHAFNEKRKKKL